MAAAAGASGVRAWLQAHRFAWLTPKRLRLATIVLFVVAFGLSSVRLSGSSAATTAEHQTQSPHVVQSATR